MEVKRNVERKEVEEEVLAPIIQEFQRLIGRGMTRRGAFEFMAGTVNLQKCHGLKFQLYPYMEEPTKLLKERVNTKITDRLTDPETANVRREIAKSMHRYTRTQCSSQRREGYTLEGKKISKSSMAAPTANAKKGFNRQDYSVFRADLKESFGDDAAPWRSNYEVSTV